MKKIAVTLDVQEIEKLLKAVTIASAMYGPLGDFVDAKYKKESKTFEKLEALLCKQVSSAGLKEPPLEDDEGVLRLAMQSSWYEGVWEDIHTYDDYILATELAYSLAWRDFTREHSEKELEVISEKNGGYFGVEMYPYEDKYWKEFDAYDFDRLEIRKDDPMT
jgi:hypothetical protein